MKTVQQFLELARTAVRTGFKNESILLVTGNESADLDSFASSLLFAYLTASYPRPNWPTKAYSAIVPLVNIPHEEVSLRPELHHLLDTLKIPTSHLICKDEFLEAAGDAIVDVSLLDHNNLLSELGELYGDNIVTILDHHEDENLHTEASPRIINMVGSCTTLVVEYFSDVFKLKDESDLQPQSLIDLAKLALAPILVDTANLTSKDTPADHEAVKMLITVLTAGAVSTQSSDDRQQQYYDELITAKRSIDDFSLRDILRKDYKEWQEDNGVRVGIASSVKSLAWTVTKFGETDFKNGINDWAKERKLDAFAFMDSFTDAKGAYRRDLVVVSCTPKGDKPARDFVTAATEEFKLIAFDSSDGVATSTDESAGFWCFKQLNLQASRKQVAPLIRRFMQA
ncbi:hypothetical protein V1512DRAFT_217919 [Lipomyces arxii]|uniref:uncharacterized protein n=1 Tax=Lipomyces arxii TaxID=56418 RepID=UPI0034CD85FC